jgi:hypothetical protein
MFLEVLSYNLSSLEPPTVNLASHLTLELEEKAAWSSAIQLHLSYTDWHIELNLCVCILLRV